jgi:hypothetical protein
MEDRTEFRGTACLLRAAVTAGYAGHAGVVIAGFALITKGFHPAMAVAVAIWALVVYWQVRASLDAALFEWLAEGAKPNEIDHFLHRAGLIGPPRERTAADRCRGGAGIARRLVGAVLAEWVAVLVGIAL